MNFFGLAIALNFILASFFLWQEVKRRGLSQEKATDLLLGHTFFAFFFARLFYIFFHLEVFSVDFGRALLITRYPGFDVIGILVGWILAGLIFLWREKDEIWLYSDVFAPAATIFTVGIYLINREYFIAAMFLVLFLALRFIGKSVQNWPEVAKKLDRHGFLGLFYLLFLFIVNFPLAFLRHDPVYYFWIFGLWLTATVFFSRYRKIFKIMIKFPAQVLTQIRSFLEDRRKKTEKQIVELKKEDPFADTDRLLDNAEQGSEAEEKAGHERIEALTHQLSLGLIEIKKALTKIKIGNYGICEKCGKMIDTDRLAAIPTAVLCVTCERKKEK